MCSVKVTNFSTKLKIHSLSIGFELHVFFLALSQNQIVGNLWNAPYNFCILSKDIFVFCITCNTVCSTTCQPPPFPPLRAPSQLRNLCPNCSGDSFVSKEVTTLFSTAVSPPYPRACQGKHKHRYKYKYKYK